MLWVKTEQVCATCVKWGGSRKETYSFVEPKEHIGQCKSMPSKVTSHQCSCQLWRGLKQEWPATKKEPVSV